MHVSEYTIILVFSFLQSMRSDERFSLFWQRTIQKSDERGIAEPVLPRRRKAPCRFEPGNSTGPGATPDTPEDRYRVLYFETLDVVTTCVKDRFEQEGYKIYKQLEQLLITKGQGNNEELIKFYGDDFEGEMLQTQLQLFHDNYSIEPCMSVHNLHQIVIGMSSAEKTLFSQVVKLLRLLLVMPATNAVSERSFSSMCRIKTYLRSTMSQERLNSTMVLHIHKDCTDKLNLKSIANEFCTKSDSRKLKFPTFTE